MTTVMMILGGITLVLAGYAIHSSNRRAYEQEALTEERRLMEGITAIHAVGAWDEPHWCEIRVAPDDRPCPCCNGRRCTAWRETDHTYGCGGHTEYDKCFVTDADGHRLDGCGGEAEPLPAGVTWFQYVDRCATTAGRHTLRYVVEHRVPWNWNPFPLRMRVSLSPNAWAKRLGRPAQLGKFRTLAGALP